MNFTHQNYHRVTNSQASDFRAGVAYNSVTNNDREKDIAKKGQQSQAVNGQIQPFKLLAFPKLLSDNDIYIEA